MKRLALPVLLALVSSGCSIVKRAYVRDDWAATDAPKVKRLAVVVQPLPEGQAKAGEVFARIARRYVNQKRDFLVKVERFAATAPELDTLCGGDDAIEGVLWLHPDVKGVGDGFEASLKASLVRCGDGREAWAAEANGSFDVKDAGLVEVTGVYVRELGPEAERYVPLAMNLLRPMLDTLPQPVLTEDDVTEKLGLD